MTEEIKAATEEDKSPWTRLRKEVQGMESGCINPKMRARFDQTKRLTLELLAGLESRNCPHVPQAINERGRVLYAKWENQDTGTSMQVFLEDDTSEVQVSGRAGLVADYEWSKADKTQVVLCYLPLVFPSDPPGLGQAPSPDQDLLSLGDSSQVGQRLFRPEQGGSSGHALRAPRPRVSLAARDHDSSPWWLGSGLEERSEGPSSLQLSRRTRPYRRSDRWKIRVVCAERHGGSDPGAFEDFILEKVKND